MTTAQEGQMTPDQRRKFIREHRTAIFGYGRKDHGPAMTVVYYVMDGDDILVSTMLDRGKAKASSVTPRCRCACWTRTGRRPTSPSSAPRPSRRPSTTTSDAVVDVLVGVLELMAGRELDASAREHATKMAVKEDRVVASAEAVRELHDPAPPRQHTRRTSTP